jgi:DNA-binding MarR family transcriptional regulator
MNVTTYDTSMSEFSTRVPPLQQTAFLAVVRAGQRVLAGASEQVRSRGLTETQYNVLRILRGAGPRGLACGQVGERMLTRVPDVTRLLDRLAAAGWVERVRAEDDRRRVVNRITDEGRALLARLDRPVRDLHRSQFADLDEEELSTLVRLLDRVAADASRDRTTRRNR